MADSSPSTCPKCGAPIPEDAPQGLCPKCVLAGAATTPATGSGRTGGTPPPSVAELAAHFPDLEIVELIGAGGMGAVYKARQPKLDRFVALKVLSHDLAADPAFEERFNREARVLARLSHPNIVTVFDFGTAGPHCYLLMEFIDGVNLRQAMRAGGFTPPDALALVQDICAALQFAHEEGILHRDIKPENILLDARGRVKIADFGIAKLVDTGRDDDYTLTMQGAVLGSPHYMAPEQIQTPGDVDQRADIYSLGVVFYELLTGELPLGRFAPPSESRPMDSRIDEVVMRALERKREARYQSAGEVRTQVEDITRTQPAAAPPPPPAPTAEPAEAMSAAPVAASPTPATPAPSASADLGTARFATASAVLTGISLVLALGSLFLLVPWLAYAGHHENGADTPTLVNSLRFTVFILFITLPAGVLALLGTGFGVRALGDLRRSGGRKAGLGRAMFGALGWPVLILVAVTAMTSAQVFMALFGPGVLWLLAATIITVALGVLVIVATWRWAKAIPRGVRSHERNGTGIGMVMIAAAVILLLPTLAILLPWGLWTVSRVPLRPHRSEPSVVRAEPVEKRPTTSSRTQERPGVKLGLTVAPGLVVTYQLVRTGEGAGEEPLPGFGGYVLASDAEPCEGALRVATAQDPSSPTGLRMELGLELAQGATSSIGGTLDEAWVVLRKDLGRLNLSSPGEHRFQVAELAPRKGATASVTMELQVTSLARAVPGFPRITQESEVFGWGAASDWIEHVKRLHPEYIAELHLRALLEDDVATLENTYAKELRLMPGHEFLQKEYGLAGPRGHSAATTVERTRLLDVLKRGRQSPPERSAAQIEAILQDLSYESLDVTPGDFAITPADPAGTPDGKLSFPIEPGDRLIKVTSTREIGSDFLLFQLRRILGEWKVVAELMD